MRPGPAGTTGPKIGAGKLAAIYVRAPDRTESDRVSVEAQLTACQSLATALGYVVLSETVFQDAGTSASSSRPGLTALFRAIEERGIAAVFAYRLDRLARGTATLQESLLKELRRRKTPLYLACVARGYRYDEHTGRLRQDPVEIAAANRADARPVEYIVIPVEGE